MRELRKLCRDQKY